MPTNDFQTFSGAAGANVITQAQYLALAAQQTGFQAGPAASAQVNKVLRQSSIISSVLAQFIVNNSGQNVLDDGTTATILANLTAALNKAATPLVAFRVNFNNVAASLTAGNVFQVMPFSHKDFDTNSAYNIATNTFTAPVAGYYQFNYVGGYIATATGSMYVQGVLYKNGAAYRDSTPSGSNNALIGQEFDSSGSCVMLLNANDTVVPYFGIYGTVGGLALDPAINSSAFEGILVHTL